MLNSKHNRYIYITLTIIVLIVCVILITIKRSPSPYQHNTGFIFNTVYNIQYQSDSDVSSEIVACLNSVDAALSPFKKGSIISKVNHNECVSLNKMFTDVLLLAEEVSMETDGAFDITVAPIVNAWGFGFKNGIKPTPHVIDSLMEIVGHEKVSLVDNCVKKEDPRVTLDCGAIAKGYGCDMVANLLRHKGIRNFIVEIGGEIVANGVNESGDPWRIGVARPIDNPAYTSKELQTILNITGNSMATSGNYRNYRYDSGKKYAHTIDPRTGFPTQNDIISATVLAKDCAMADAYATAFMVKGLKGTREILEKHHELMAYIIYLDKTKSEKVWYSPALKEKIIEIE